MPPAAAAGRPNIVLVITDQQRYDTIAALGHPYVDTPNLDRLVREGVSFDECHVTAASCVPARASLFNGLYPHTTGVLRNGCEWRRSWVEQLAASGYHCVNVGKMHTIPFETPLGFHERYVVENKDRFLEGRYYFDEWDKALAARGLVKQQRELYRQRPDYGEAMGAFTWDLPADMHSDNFVGGLARWWLDTYPTTQPLFLEVGFPGPHPPYDPTPEALAPYLERDLPIQPVTKADLDGQPEALRVMREHNTEVDHDSVVHIVDPPLEFAAAAAGALPGQRDDDRRTGWRNDGCPGAQRLCRRLRGDLHLRPRRLPGRPRPHPEVDHVRHDHPRALHRLVA